MTAFDIPTQALTDALAELVSIPSINPDLVPGAGGEQALSAAIADRLRRTPGITVELQDAGGGRPNVIATVGNGPGRTLMLNGHIDTVGVAGMSDPFTPRIEGGRLYGRGSYDMKGPMAATIVLLEAIAQADDFPGRLIVTYVVDEEFASIGTQAICRDIDRRRPDAAIVLENSNLDICVAHKGFAWAEIVTQGRAMHGSRYWLGIDAIAHMGRVIGELEALGRDLIARAPHPYIGPPSIHASLIQGGQELSSYPDTCSLHLERRTIPGETSAQIQHELQTILDRLAAADPQFNATLTMGLVRDPFEVPDNAEIVLTLAESCRAIRGESPKLIGKAGWADTALLAAAGIPSAYFGPSGGGAHALEEWIDLDSLESFTHTLAHTTYTFCAAGTS